MCEVEIVSGYAEEAYFLVEKVAKKLVFFLIVCNFT